MTAEVIVMNKSAIAVAADSAVTRGRTKVHLTANKIFQLSKFNPVGIVIFGNAYLLNLPWELIIKTYRGQIHDQSFDTVDGYADDFCNFLKSPKLVTEAASDLDRAGIFIGLAQRIEKRLRRQNGKNFKSEFSKHLTQFISQIRKAPKLDLEKPLTLRQFRKQFRDDCAVVLETVFKGKKFGARSKLKFEELCFLFCESDWTSDTSTGFAIFGFGTKQILPAITTVGIDGAPLNEIRFTSKHTSNLDRADNKAALYALAQADATSLFMEGVDANLKTFSTRAFELALKKFLDEVVKKELSNYTAPPGQTDVTLALLRNSIDTIAKGMKREIDKYIRTKSINRVLDALDGLAKEDLANLVESLVELTAIKRRISNEMETVAGPVDVAVVSKNDGFIWIKRKHYFDPAYNGHFRQNYLRKPLNPLE
ncbi:MAG TPA: hypothetical protein VNR39_09945 [Pseudolabrys sp.]|nr:hypothetical protein [Pseudolabrys sp.]